jgi:hypothetical protein
MEREERLVLPPRAAVRVHLNRATRVPRRRRLLSDAGEGGGPLRLTTIRVREPRARIGSARVLSRRSYRELPMGFYADLFLRKQLCHFSKKTIPFCRSLGQLAHITCRHSCVNHVESPRELRIGEAVVEVISLLAQGWGDEGSLSDRSFRQGNTFPRGLDFLNMHLFDSGGDARSAQIHVAALQKFVSQPSPNPRTVPNCDVGT